MLNGKCERLVADVSNGKVNRPSTRNTRDAIDFVQAKAFATKNLY